MEVGKVMMLRPIFEEELGESGWGEGLEILEKMFSNCWEMELLTYSKSKLLSRPWPPNFAIVEDKRRNE